MPSELSRPAASAPSTSSEEMATPTGISIPPAPAANSRDGGNIRNESTSSASPVMSSASEIASRTW
jgi:hypothetical protein